MLTLHTNIYSQHLPALQPGGRGPGEAGERQHSLCMHPRWQATDWWGGWGGACPTHYTHQTWWTLTYSQGKGTSCLVYVFVFVAVGAVAVISPFIIGIFTFTGWSFRGKKLEQIYLDWYCLSKFICTNKAPTIGNVIINSLSKFIPVKLRGRWGMGCDIITFAHAQDGL